MPRAGGASASHAHFIPSAPKNLVRSVSEPAITVSDSVSRMKAANRSVTPQTVTVGGGTTARTKAANRSVSTQTTTVSGGTTTRTKAANRAPSTETVTVGGGSTTRTKGVVRAVPLQTVLVSDVVVRVAAVFKRVVTTQVTAISDSVTRKKAANRSVSTQTTAISDSVTRKEGANRSVTLQTVAVSDSVTRKKAANRSVPTQTVSISELVSRAGAVFKRVVSTQVTVISDSATRTKGVNRSVTPQTVAISESVTRKKAATRAVPTQTVTVGGGITTRTKAAIRAVGLQTVIISESVASLLTTGAKNLVRAVGPETVTVSGSPTRTKGVNRSVTPQTVAISDSVTRARALTRQAGKTWVNLDGVNDYVNCGDHADLWSQTLTKFSFSIRMYVKAGVATSALLVDHQSNLAQSFVLYVSNVDGSALTFRINNAAAVNVNCTASSGFPNFLDREVNVVCTYDNSLGSLNMKMYIDGVRVGNQPNLTESLTKTGILTIAGAVNDLKGYAKDFRFWDSIALTQAQVTDVYNNAGTAPTPDYWLPMQENSGNPLDVIGGKTATLTNGAGWIVQPDAVTLSELVTRRLALTRQAGKNMLAFDGIDDGLTIPNIAAINNLDDFTISCWIYPTSFYATNTPSIFLKLYPANNGIIGYFTTNSYQLNFRTVNASGTGVSASTNHIVTNGPNRWYHLLFSFVRSTGVMKIFIDGVQRATATNTGLTANAVGTVANLGINSGGGAVKWGGYMRDFRLYRSDQSAEVIDIMNNDIAAPTPDYWLPMDEGRGAPINVISPATAITLNGGIGWATEPDSTPVSDLVTRSKGAIRRLGVNVNSLFFNGVNGRVNCGQHTDLWNNAALSAFSFSVWVKFNTLNDGTNFREIIQRGWGQNSGFTCYYVNTLPRVAIEVASTWPTRVSAMYSTIPNQTGVYYNLIVVYDGGLSSGAVKLFINGLVGVQSVDNAGIALNNASDLLIGGTANDHHGNIKDLRWYKRALTLAEIQAIANDVGDNIPYDYRLPMEEGTGNPLDIVNGYTTTIGGTVTWDTSVPPQLYEGAVVSDSVMRSLAKTRTVLEPAIIIDDSVDRIKAAIRSVVNSVVVTGVPTRTKAAFRTVALQTVIVGGGAATRVKGAVRAVALQTVIVGGGTATRLKAATRIVPTQTVVVTGVANRVAVLKRVVATQTVVISDSVVGLREAITAKARSVVEPAVVIADSVTRLFTGRRVVSPQSVPVTGTATRTKGVSRTVTPQNTSVSDSVTRKAAKTRAVPLESTPISTSVLRIKGAVRSIIETVTVGGGTTTRNKAATRSISQTVPVVGSVTRMAQKARIVATQNVIVTGTVSRTKGAVRSIVQTVTVIGTATRSKAAKRVVAAQNISVSDSVTRIAEKIRVVAVQNTIVTGTVSRMLILKRVVTTQVTNVTDSVIGTKSAFQQLTRFITEPTVLVNDFTNRVLSARRTIVSFLTISESVTRTAALKRTAVNNVPVSDSVVGTKTSLLKHLVRTVTEPLISVFDSVTRKVELTRFVSEVVGGVPVLLPGEVPDTVRAQRAICSFLRQNWSLPDPPSTDILWDSWYTGQDDITVQCEEMITTQRPQSTNWQLRVYDGFVNIHIFVREQSGLYPQRLDKMRAFIDSLFSQNPTGLQMQGIDLMYPYIFTPIRYEADPEWFHLIVRIQLKYWKNWPQS